MLALVFVQAVKDLLLRLVANGAGVVEDQAGIFLRLDLPVTFVLQCANDLFRVMGIHLAAKGLYIEGSLGCHSNSKYTVVAFLLIFDRSGCDGLSAARCAGRPTTQPSARP